MKTFTHKLILSLSAFALIAAMTTDSQASLRDVVEHPLNEIKRLEGEVKPELSTLKHKFGNFTQAVQTDLSELIAFKKEVEPFLAELKLLLAEFGGPTGADIAKDITRGEDVANSALNLASNTTQIIDLAEAEGTKIIGTDTMNKINDVAHIIDSNMNAVEVHPSTSVLSAGGQ